LTLSSLVLTVEIEKQQGSQKPYLFRSYPYDKRNSSGLNRLPHRELEKVPIQIVASATCAAPTYFASVKTKELPAKKFRDGTLWSVNPAMEVYREILSLHESRYNPHPIELILSIGSGALKPQGTFRRRRNSLTTQHHPEQLEVHDTMDQRSKLEDFEYFRLDGPSELSGLNLDEWKDDKKGHKTFKRVESYVTSYCATPEVQATLQKCAESLVALRHKRAATDRWERFALGIYYTCDLCAKRQRFRVKKTSPSHKPASNGEEPVPMDAHRDRLHINRIPLGRTLSGQSDMGSINSLVELARRASAASGSALSDMVVEAEDILDEIPLKPKDFDSRNDFITHLQREHEAPPPDVVWKPIIDEWVVKRAHTKLR
jgi:hypothetical protein